MKYPLSSADTLVISKALPFRPPSGIVDGPVKRDRSVGVRRRAGQAFRRGIVAIGVGHDGIARVLEDATGRYAPNEWARPWKGTGGVPG